MYNMLLKKTISIGHEKKKGGAVSEGYPIDFRYPIVSEMMHF